MYIVSYMFIAPSRRNDALQLQTKNKVKQSRFSVQKGIELRVCLQP